MAKKKSSRTEGMREALHASRKPKTCRELMEIAGIKKDDFKFAAAILVAFQNRGEVKMSEARECTVSHRTSQTYLLNRQKKEKVEKNSTESPVVAAPAQPEASVVKKGPTDEMVAEAVGIFKKELESPEFAAALKAQDNPVKVELPPLPEGLNLHEIVQVKLLDGNRAKFFQKRGEDGRFELFIQLMTPKFKKAALLEKSDTPFELQKRVKESPSVVEILAS